MTAILMFESSKYQPRPETDLTRPLAAALPAAFLALAIFALGSIWFGKFEEGTPKWRRTLKLFVVVAAVGAIAQRFGSRPAIGLLAAIAVIGLVVHFTWCRRHGIDPWTAEPWELYRRLRGWTT